jgi:hypothetical protein
MDRNAAIAKWNAVKDVYAANGLILPGVRMLIPDEMRHSIKSLNEMAMDAAGNLSTDPNAALPSLLTTAIDPDVIRIVFAPLQIAKILGGEKKAGDWLEETRIFPVAPGSTSTIRSSRAICSRLSSATASGKPSVRG